MPTEAYALCQIVPHVTEKGYITNSPLLIPNSQFII